VVSSTDMWMSVELKPVNPSLDHRISRTQSGLQQKQLL